MKFKNIEKIQRCLEDIGYKIDNVDQRENNGKFWQIRFRNSKAIITIYESLKRMNTVVNGKCSQEEIDFLKNFIEDLKRDNEEIDPLNKTIVELIDSGQEDFFYDFKEELNLKKKENFIHDILCLSNNLENREAYLIIGVSDSNEIIGDNKVRKDYIFDVLKKVKFAGNKKPELEVKKLKYHYKDISVIVCKKSNKIPYFLSEKYGKVRPGIIYTRIGDTNTPIDKLADYNDIEELWRKHFKGLNYSDENIDIIF